MSHADGGSEARGRCPDCGGRRARWAALGLLAAPVLLGAGGVLLLVAGTGLTRGEVLALVTAAFIAFLLILGPLARRLLESTGCPRCHAGQ